MQLHLLSCRFPADAGGVGFLREDRPYTHMTLNPLFSERAVVSEAVPSLPYYRPKPLARLLLFCFPYAGGGASIFNAWSEKLPPEIEVGAVQLPGRENRLSEVCFTRMEDAVSALANDLRALVDTPFAFFGHSLGARLAFELAHRLRETTGREPAHLFASACRAPQVPPQSDPIHGLPENEFVQQLRERHNVPEAILQDAELRGVFLPQVRADFTVSETYRYVPGEPLHCPISAIGGVEDTSVEREHLTPWREHTDRSFELCMLPGDHFFVNSRRERLLQVLAQVLMRIVRGPSE